MTIQFEQINSHKFVNKAHCVDGTRGHKLHNTLFFILFLCVGKKKIISLMYLDYMVMVILVPSTKRCSTSDQGHFSLNLYLIPGIFFIVFLSGLESLKVLSRLGH